MLLSGRVTKYILEKKEVGSGSGFSCSKTSNGTLTGPHMLQSLEPHFWTSKE